MQILLAQTTTTTEDDGNPLDFVGDFFDSEAWLVIRNVTLFFLVVFWLASAYWVYKDARRRIEDPWLLAMAVALGIFPPFVGPLLYMFFRPPEYLEDVRERERRRGGDEFDELAEERLLPVLRVVLPRERLVHQNQLRGPDLQPPLLEAREDLAGKSALHRVRLDQDEGTFRHASRRRSSASSRFFAFQKIQAT